MKNAVTDPYVKEVLNTIASGFTFTVATTAAGAEIGIHFGPQGATFGAACGAIVGVTATAYAVSKIRRPQPVVSI